MMRLRSANLRVMIPLVGQKKYIDHHAHVWGTGYKELHLKLDNARSIEEVLDILRPSLKGLEQELRDLQLLTPNPEPQTPFLTARGWDQNKWQQHHFPTRDDLDALSTEIPIALTRIDGHAMWCNSKALEAAHITRSTTAPSGGDIVKTTSGSPTGILLDDAMQLIFDVLPVESDASVIKTLRTGLDTFAKHHYEVHDMGIPAEWWQPYKTLYSDHGDALIKAKVFLDMSKPSGKSLFLQKMNEDVFNDSPHPNLELVGIKLYLDGALGSRGAQLFKPYADDPTNSGLSLISDDEAFHLMSLASDRGLTIAIH